MVVYNRHLYKLFLLSGSKVAIQILYMSTLCVCVCKRVCLSQCLSSSLENRQFCRSDSDKTRDNTKKKEKKTTQGIIFKQIFIQFQLVLVQNSSLSLLFCFVILENFGLLPKINRQTQNKK